MTSEENMRQFLPDDGFDGTLTIPGSDLISGSRTESNEPLNRRLHPDKALRGDAKVPVQVANHLNSEAALAV